MPTQVRTGSIASSNALSPPLLSFYDTGSSANPPGRPISAGLLATNLGVPIQVFSSYTSPIVYTGTPEWTDIAWQPDSNPNGLRLALAVGICPGGGWSGRSTSDAPQFTAAETLSNLSVFQTLAENLCNGSLNGSYVPTQAQPDAILRVGWECNSNSGANSGYSWTWWDPGTGGGGANYVAAWKAIVNTMRAQAKITNAANGLGSVSLFKFDWNTNVLSTHGDATNDQYTFSDGAAAPNASNGYAANTWYPSGVDAYGVPYVDIISVDSYDNGYSEFYIDNLQDTIHFALAQGKRWAVPEWGLSGTDNPGYINTFYKMVNGIPQTNPDGGGPALTIPAYYESYFNQYGSILFQTVQNCVLTSGSQNVTNPTTGYAFYNMSNGLTVSGTGVQAGTTISSIGNTGGTDQSMVMSKTATQSITTTLTFTWQNSTPTFTNDFG